MRHCRFQVCVVEKTITAAEADREFCRVLREVREGESYVVTEDGRPVARIAPAQAPAESDAEIAARREKAREELFARLRSQKPMNLGRVMRDDAYDD